MMYSLGIMQGRLTIPKGRGIQFFPFDNWKQEFYSAKKIGLNEIEFIFDYDNYLDNPLWTEEGVKEIESVMLDTNISIRSICFDYFMRRPFYKYSGKKQNEIREENTRIIKTVICSMIKLGVELIEIPSVDASSIKTDMEKTLFSDWIREIATSFPNIRFGLETDMPPHTFLNFIEQINLVNVGANYDSGNSSGLGYDSYEEVTTLRDHIFNIHIKDREYKGLTKQLGTGDADFDRLFTGLKDIGYKHSFILQAARGMDGEEVSNILFQKEYLEKLIERYLEK